MAQSVANLQQVIYTGVMDLEALAHNLRMRRLDRSWTMDRLQVESGVDKGTISRLERKLMLRPSATHVAALATALGATTEELTSWQRGQGETTPVRQGRTWIGSDGKEYEEVFVPIVGRVSAMPGVSESNEDGGLTWSREKTGKASKLQAAIVTGDCLEPEYRPGDRVIFDPDKSWFIGAIIVFKAKNGHQVKRLVAYERKKLTLESKYGRIDVMDEDTRIEGVVTGLQRTVI